MKMMKWEWKRFNSTKVRLKADIKDLKAITILFQFYKSAIKRSDIIFLDFNPSKFQFYKSAIKSYLFANYI